MTAEQIWNVLEKHCGANSEFMKENFLDLVGEAIRKNSRLEYRFCGALGYGGKLYVNLCSAPLRVDCYVESYTPERREMIETANKALDALVKGS